jgi:hypothetical protein
MAEGTKPSATQLDYGKKDNGNKNTRNTNC